jgi:hypothetical protein
LPEVGVGVRKWPVTVLIVPKTPLLSLFEASIVTEELIV